jgi:hypothetical protein
VLAGLLTLCLIPRTIMAWRMPGICPDAVFYIRLGKAIEMGQFQEALGQIHFNIYPFILAFLHKLGLSWETAGVAWGVVISACTVLPLYGWISRAFSRTVAIAACILYAIHAELIRCSVEIIRDSTFWFLLVLSLYLLWRAVTELRWTWYLAAGAAIALASLTRLEGPVLFVPLVGWSWWRAREGDVSRGRLIAASLLCASIYPLSLMLVNGLLFHGRTTDLVRLRTAALAQDWAQESLTGQPALERRSRTDLLAPMPLGKMAERFVTGLAKGITPLYLLVVAGGIAAWRRLPARGSSTGFQPVKRSIGFQPVGLDTCKTYFALAFAAALILAAIWVHLYWSHEAGPRYFFPIVLMAAPLAGRGLLQISGAVANRVRRQHSPWAALLAGAAPLAIMLVVNLSVAWGGDVRARAATVDLGHWVQAHFGSATRMFGPDGITQVVNHYAQGKCESFPETAMAAAVVRQMGRFRPNVVLLPTDRPGLPGDKLPDYVAALGFEAVDRSSLPDGCEKLLVLVRRNEQNTQGDKPRS